MARKSIMPTTSKYAELENARLAREIALALGWRIEPVVEKKRILNPAIVEDDLPPDVQPLAPSRNFSQWLILNPEGQQVARGIAEYDIAVFLPEWLTVLVDALALPMNGNKWLIDVDANTVAVVDATGAALSTHIDKRMARAACIAWLEAKDNG